MLTNLKKSVNSIQCEEGPLRMKPNFYLNKPIPHLLFTCSVLLLILKWVKLVCFGCASASQGTPHLLHNFVLEKWLSISHIPGEEFAWLIGFCWANSLTQSQWMVSTINQNSTLTGEQVRVGHRWGRGDASTKPFLAAICLLKIWWQRKWMSLVSLIQITWGELATSEILGCGPTLPRPPYWTRATVHRKGCSVTLSSSRLLHLEKTSTQDTSC